MTTTTAKRTYIHCTDCKVRTRGGNDENSTRCYCDYCDTPLCDTCYWDDAVERNTSMSACSGCRAKGADWMRAYRRAESVALNGEAATRELFGEE